MHTLKKISSKLFYHINNFFFPPLCSICKISINSREFLCSSCEKIEYLQEDYTIEVDYTWFEHISFFKFDFTVRELLHSFKFNKKYYALYTLVKYIQKKDLDYIKNWDVNFITYVPMNKFIQLFRGYDHSKIIAEVIAKKLNLSVKKTLKKKFSFSKQSKKDKKSRLKKRKCIFKIKNNVNINSSNILLIDDILTTGQTLQTCTQLLQKNDSGNIYVLTLAKG